MTDYMCGMQALRRDLRYMEQDASAFAAAMEEASDALPTQVIQQLKGRFTFLWGMYKAHSEVNHSGTKVACMPACLQVWRLRSR